MHPKTAVNFRQSLDTCHVGEKIWLMAAEAYQLGADDGVGIWLMLRMISAGVEGLYIFHADEEIGGGGSRHIADETPQLLDGIVRAVAFDRKGTRSVITHQGIGRCCSDKFGQALGEALGMGYTIDDTGVFTDTANYTHLVPECTNVSSGYYREHTLHEHLDVTHATALANALTKVQWGELPVERQPDQPQSDGDFDEILAAVLREPEATAMLLQDFGLCESDIETIAQFMQRSSYT